MPVNVFYIFYVVYYLNQRAKEKCEGLQCPYGIMRYRDDRSQCIVCYCNEPCEGYECTQGTKCVVEVVNNKKDQSQQTTDANPEYR